MSEVNPGRLTSQHIATRLAQGNLQNSERNNCGICRRAAVLIPLLVEDGVWKMLFTLRTDFVADHKGQVSFPGGAQDSRDESLEATALRETDEEIGLATSAIHLLGRLPDYPTITEYLITPVVAWIDWPVSLHLSQDEVSKWFTIPLIWLADRSHYYERVIILQDRQPHNVIYFQPYDGETLWGVTARMALNFLWQIGF